MQAKEVIIFFVPVVRVFEAKKQNINLPVYSQGLVQPKNEIQILSRVNGPVTFVSPNLVDGGQVEEGEVLLKVSDRVYQQDKAKVEANLARAKAIQVAKKSELRVRGTLRTEAGKAQLREVNAAVAAAEADVTKIQDLIEATEIKAPFCWGDEKNQDSTWANDKCRCSHWISFFY